MENTNGFYTLPRARILSLLKKHPKGLSKEKISRETKINRTSVLHHISILEKNNLVKVSKRQRGIGFKGSPQVVTLTNKSDPISLKSIEIFEKLINVFKS